MTLQMSIRSEGTDSRACTVYLGTRTLTITVTVGTVTAAITLSSRAGTALLSASARQYKSSFLPHEVCVSKSSASCNAGVPAQAAMCPHSAKMSPYQVVRCPAQAPMKP